MTLDELPQLPTVAQCAAVLGVDPSTLYTWIRVGEFPERIVRTVNGTMRISKLDLIDYLHGSHA